MTRNQLTFSKGCHQLKHIVIKSNRHRLCAFHQTMFTFALLRVTQDREINTKEPVIYLCFNVPIIEYPCIDNKKSSIIASLKQHIVSTALVVDGS